MKWKKKKKKVRWLPSDNHLAFRGGRGGGGEWSTSDAASSASADDDDQSTAKHTLNTH